MFSKTYQKSPNIYLTLKDLLKKLEDFVVFLKNMKFIVKLFFCGKASLQVGFPDFNETVLMA